MDHTSLRLVICIDCDWKYFISASSDLTKLRCGICGGLARNLFFSGEDNNDSEA